MSNAEIASSSTSIKDRAPVDVDPAILAVIKSASVPVAVPKNVRPPDELPGTLNPITGFRVLLDLLRRGVEAALDFAPCTATSTASRWAATPWWASGMPMPSTRS